MPFAPIVEVGSAFVYASTQVCELLRVQVRQTQSKEEDDVQRPGAHLSYMHGRKGWPNE